MSKQGRRNYIRRAQILRSRLKGFNWPGSGAKPAQTSKLRDRSGRKFGKIVRRMEKHRCAVRGCYQEGRR